MGSGHPVLPGPPSAIAHRQVEAFRRRVAVRAETPEARPAPSPTNVAVEAWVRAEGRRSDPGHRTHRIVVCVLSSVAVSAGRIRLARYGYRPAALSVQLHPGPIGYRRNVAPSVISTIETPAGSDASCACLGRHKADVKPAALDKGYRSFAAMDAQRGERPLCLRDTKWRCIRQVVSRGAVARPLPDCSPVPWMPIIRMT